MSKFSKVSIQDATYVEDESNQFVLHVNTPHALIQAAGYLKHTAEPYERVYFRGQRKLHKTLPPSLYRGLTLEKSQGSAHEKINSTVELFRNTAKIFQKMPEYAHEPLLQHYGINTTWVDIVDNIWIALWFAMHKAHSAGKKSEFLHFENAAQIETAQYGYIILVCVDEDRKSKAKKGIVTSRNFETIDLRIAAPSIFLRPHAQHGLLFRARHQESLRPLDYSHAIAGIIRFNTKDAANWLGQGTMHNVRALFPPPFFDKGYMILLGCDIPDSSIGCIHHIGA
jgi:hypothetical protein